MFWYAELLATRWFDDFFFHFSFSVFPRISVSGSVGFRYHGNGREARHLFRDFEQKSDSCNIAGLGCQPDRVPSRGYRGGPGKWDRNPRKSLFWGHDQKIDYTYWSLFDIPSWNSHYWSRGGFRWICLRGDQLPHFQGMCTFNKVSYIVEFKYFF